MGERKQVHPERVGGGFGLAKQLDGQQQKQLE